jgi:hypothetical protein
MNDRNRLANYIIAIVCFFTAGYLAWQLWLR